MNGKYMLALLLLIGISCKKQDSLNTSKALTTYESELNKVLDSNITVTKKIHYLNGQLKRSELFNAVAQIKYLRPLSLAYLKLDHPKRFRSVNTKITNKALAHNHRFDLAQAYFDLGKFFETNQQSDSAFFLYDRSFKILGKNQVSPESKELFAKTRYAIAGIQHDIKDYVGSEKTIISYLRYIEDNNIAKFYFRGYNLLATNQSGLNNFDKALEYHQKAKEMIAFAEKEEQQSFYFYNTNNIASTYLRSGNFSLAKTLYSELIHHEQLKTKRPSTYGKALTSLVYCNFKLQAKNHEELKSDFDDVFEFYDRQELVYDKARANEYYAEFLLEQGKVEEAIEIAEKAKNIAQETKNFERLQEVLRFLIQHDSENSSEHAKEYFDLSEKLLAEERNTREKFALISMETEQIEEENIKLAKQRELLVGIAVGLLLLAIGVITIISQRISNQKLKFEKTQQESNQEIYNLMLTQKGKMEEGKKSEQRRISQELHDGILGQMLGIRLILSGLNERSDEDAIDQRAELIDRLQQLEEEIRVISHELNQESYKKVDNFVLALNDLLETSKKTGGVKIHSNLKASIDWNIVKGESKINIYRIVQESLQNCLKHAKSSNIYLTLTEFDNNLVIEIRDDGMGYNTSKNKRGIGLKNIISRTKKLKGKLDIESIPGKGTNVRASIPMGSLMAIMESVKEGNSGKKLKLGT